MYTGVVDQIYFSVHFNHVPQFTLSENRITGHVFHSWADTLRNDQSAPSDKVID